MIIKERLQKILLKIIDQAERKETYIENLYLNSCNNDLQWVIKFKNFDDYCIMEWILLTKLSKKDKIMELILEPNYEFYYSQKNDFINKIYKEFEFYMGYSLCNCKKYKLNNYKHCLTCFLTLDYFKDECSVCYEKFFNHPDHYYKSPCCGHIICKSCSNKIKKKCVICR